MTAQHNEENLFSVSSQERIVALIDMDCFYVQVEQRLAPEWKGKPCVVVQYNNWKGGGIIAVSYEARAMGVSRRNMRGDDAQRVCPDCHVFRVPEVRGKADLTRYRDAGAEVITVLSQFAKCVERASVDEAYIDITDEVDEMMVSANCAVEIEDLPATHVVGSDDDCDERETCLKDWLQQTYSSSDSIQEQRLALGARIVENMRKAVLEQTGFHCSAGISHNKVLSKLACGLHKPRKQTILPMSAVPQLFATMPIGKVRHLGGKLGQTLIECFQLKYMADICHLSKQDLKSKFGEKTGNFLYDLCRGHDPEPVSSRQLPKSVGCSKTFSNNPIVNYQKARVWIHSLAEELEERLIKDKKQNNRVSRSLNLSVGFADWRTVSRACILHRYAVSAIEDSVMSALTKLLGDVKVFDPAITCLGMSAGKFNAVEGSTLSQFMHSDNTKKTSLDVFDKLSPMQSHVVASAATKGANQSFLTHFMSTSQKKDLFSGMRVVESKVVKKCGTGLDRFIVSKETMAESKVGGNTNTAQTNIKHITGENEREKSRNSDSDITKCLSFHNIPEDILGDDFEYDDNDASTVNETSVCETSVNETSGSETAVKETPGSETPVNEAIANEPTVNETAVNEAICDETDSSNEFIAESFASIEKKKFTQHGSTYKPVQQLDSNQSDSEALFFDSVSKEKFVNSLSCEAQKQTTLDKTFSQSTARQSSMWDSLEDKPPPQKKLKDRDIRMYTSSAHAEDTNNDIKVVWKAETKGKSSLNRKASTGKRKSDQLSSSQSITAFFKPK